MYFPITCVDNFYNDPDKVREFALSLNYGKFNKGNYPGLRTDPLHKIDKDFFDIFCTKLFSLFFNFEYDDLEWNVNTSFQKIFPYQSPSKYTNEINSGWIHSDINQCILAGVIYLNPFPSSNSGTSFYELKDENKHMVCSNFDWSLRDDLYNEKEVDFDSYLNLKKEHKSMFNKTIEFKNLYNRLVCYDSSYWHQESEFLMEKEEFRLTQVFFVQELKCSEKNSPPYLKCKNYAF